MLKLMASWNCGRSYELDMTAASVDEFRLRMAELDNMGMRYYVEHENGVPDTKHLCKIHQKILPLLAEISIQNEKAR